jgi:Ca2+-binding EF-hand superfamily protein
MFQLLERTRTGLLQRGALRTAFVSLGIPPTERLLTRCLELSSLFRSRDRASRVPAGGEDRTAEVEEGVDFVTFVHQAHKQCLGDAIDTEELRELFGEFERASDKGSGEVPGFALRHVLAEAATTHDTQLSQGEVSEILEQLHLGDYDAIDYVEFVKALSSGFVQLR